MSKYPWALHKAHLCPTVVIQQSWRSAAPSAPALPPPSQAAGAEPGVPHGVVRVQYCSIYGARKSSRLQKLLGLPGFLQASCRTDFLPSVPLALPEYPHWSNSSQPGPQNARDIISFAQLIVREDKIWYGWRRENLVYPCWFWWFSDNSCQSKPRPK